MRLATLAAAVLLFGSSAFGQIVVNPRLTAEGSIDCSSAAEVVKQIITPTMTDEQKALACWKFMLDHFYHWYPPYEESCFEPVRDFAKAINSYGYSPCFGNAPVLEDLWEAAGYKTRMWTVTGHAIPEVFYGNAWHMIDADARAWHRKADGQIASVEELANNMTLFTNPKEKSDPYYPFGAPDQKVAVLDPWGPPSKMMDLYASKGDNYHFNKRAVAGHPMFVELRQGETLKLSSENQGKWFIFDKLPKDWSAEKIAKGPVDVSGKLTYGNGTLEWQPDFKKIKQADLLWMGSENVQLKDGQLSAVDAGKPAVAVFRVFCPWVLVEANGILWSGLSAKVEVSIDGGKTWAAPPTFVDEGDRYHRIHFPAIIPTAAKWPQTAPEGQMVPNAGHYEYLARVTSKEPIGGIKFTSVFQVAPLSLPRMHPGRNNFTVRRGPDQGVVYMVQSGDKAAKAPFIFEAKGITGGKGLAAADKDVPGTATFKLTAPDAIKAVSIGGNVNISRGPLPLVQADYSLDGGTTWKPVFTFKNNTNSDNTQFEEDVRIELPDNASKEFLTRFTIKGDSSHGPGKQYGGLSTVRLYAYYNLPQPAGIKLAVDLAWQEKHGQQWLDKPYSLVVDKFPTDFTIDADGQDVRLKSITFRQPE